MPSANDENWLTIMTGQVSCNKSPHFTLPKIRKKPGEFIINHFAAGVTYKVQGFVEKNTDSVNVEQLNVLKSSLVSFELLKKNGFYLSIFGPFLVSIIGVIVGRRHAVADQWAT